MRKPGSTAKVVGLVSPADEKPLASVNGVDGLLETRRLLESGACCAICMAMG